MSGIRVALLDGGRSAVELAARLAGRGHDVRMIEARRIEPLERRLRQRGYEPGLSRLPALYLSLWRHEPQLVHAFTPLDGLVAVRWARRRSRPAVLSLSDVPDRRWLLARRMRLRAMLESARGSSAVLAPSATVADAFRRSLGAEAIVTGPDATATIDSLYHELVDSHGHRS